jgi:hypothetical protein
MSLLDFALLDDLALARERMGPAVLGHLRQTSAQRLGPATELCILDRMYPAAPAGLASLRKTPASAVLRAGLNRRGAGAFYVDEAERVGAILTERDPYREDPVTWTQFCRRAQEAAEFAGLPKELAQGLVGALRELETNIHEHSGRAKDGVIGFRGTPKAVEFVVADSGIGVLAGLRRAARYSTMTDAGLALKTALADGQSRLLDVDPDRGFGFHELFVNLANLTGELRFRSDDHVLSIDGAGPALPQARLAQKARLQGFVISVVCSVTPRERMH